MHTITIFKIIIGILTAIIVCFIWNKQFEEAKQVHKEKEHPELGNIATKRRERSDTIIAWVVLFSTFFISMMAFTSSVATSGIVNSTIFVTVVLSFLLYIILALLFPHYDLHEIENKKGLPNFFALLLFAVVLEIPLFGGYVVTGNPWYGVIALLAIVLGGFFWMYSKRKRTIKQPFINPLPNFNRTISDHFAQNE